MEKLKRGWAVWRKKSAALTKWLPILGVLYLEILFHCWSVGSFPVALMPVILGFALCVGGLINAIAAALPEKAERWFTGVALFLCTTITMVELLIGDAYFNYMRPALVFVSAGGVLSDFADIMIDMIISNLGRIAISLIPFWLLLLCGKSKGSNRKPCLCISLALSVIGCGVGLGGLAHTYGSLNGYVSQYDFNNSMRQEGITCSMFMELSGLNQKAMGLEENLGDFDLVIPETEAPAEAPTEAPTQAPTEASTQAPTVPETEASTEAATQAAPAEEAPVQLAVPTESEAPTEAATEAVTESTTEAVTEAAAEEATEEATEAPTEEETEPVPEVTEPREYKPHVVEGLNFADLAAQDTDPTRKKLFTYIDSLTPAMENEYTGMFKGKNLIFIVAESFNYAIIDPELTPTLYRLSTQGINFTNYYVPLWTGNTSGGEMVTLSGLAMNCDMYSYAHQKPFNTIGRLLMNQGYFSRAYHNNAYYFYDRNKTHEDLGYEKYIGMGNGMEQGVKDVWPASDLEMFDFTLPQYIDQQPFSIYYMTVSAHCRYNFLGNAQAKKNQDLVADLPYSNGLKAYIASNLELEKGLTSLVAQLEEAGIADDTVIVLTADHFPYGLGTAWGNDHNCLAELYGVKSYDEVDRDRNALIIWSGSLEGKGLQVDAPTSSVDILPTLSNLFGVEYDSRLSIGRDVFGTEEAIVPWPDFNWVTEYGKYVASTRTFTPSVDASLVPEGYVDRINAIVKNEINFSRSIQRTSFFTTIQNYMTKNGIPLP